MGVLEAEELLVGSTLTHEVSIPRELFGSNTQDNGIREVVIRPLTVRDLQRINKATHEDETLSATLMIQHALVEPTLKLDQVSQLPAGLAKFLVERINAISGINTPRNVLDEWVQTPLARACFVLAKEFGWTPEEVSGMTIGQILLYLEMTHRNGDSE